MDRNDIEAVLLAGPTASGKSALAIRLAEAFGGAVVNADSMQVYRDLSILTARPGPADLARVPHHLFGHVDGSINHSVGLWLTDADTTLARLRSEAVLPIVTGGTGLYFRALERGLAQMPRVPDEVRARIRSEAEGQPTAALHARLAACDALTAAGLRASDRQRILRALEVVAATGVPLAEWQRAEASAPLLRPERCLRLFLAPERGDLYRRIDERFEAMLEAGALDEVAALAQRRLDPALPVMRAHGVPGLIRALEAQSTMEDAVAGAKADTRHYAKRQFTWFRHQMPGWIFVSPESAYDVAASTLGRSAAGHATLLSH
jgi:tRNA dimethylallyltransferase